MIFSTCYVSGGSQTTTIVPGCESAFATPSGGGKLMTRGTERTGHQSPYRGRSEITNQGVSVSSVRAIPL